MDDVVAQLAVAMVFDPPSRGVPGAVIATIVAAILIVVLAYVVRLLWRRQVGLPLRVEALERTRRSAASTALVAGSSMGAPAPEFRVHALDGDVRTLASLRDGKRPLLLAFTDLACGPCEGLLPRLAVWQRELRDRLRVVVVSRGAARANAARVAGYALDDVMLQDDFEVAKRYQVPGLPSAVLVTADGRVGSPVAWGERAIADLVAYAGAGSAPPAPVHSAPSGGAPPSPRAPMPWVRTGDPLPSVTLTSVDGRRAGLAEHLAGDGDALLVFWNPYCGHCQRMLPELRALEEAPGADAPRIVLVSVGHAEANRALRLRATILLDHGFDEGFGVAQQFAAPGTPSAVLVNARGRVASPVAAGAAAVLDLARRREPAAP